MHYHSRLYSLHPIGVGTHKVESLTSYINRLAFAHHVSPLDLLKYELGPEVGTYYNNEKYPLGRRVKDWFTKEGRLMNSAGSIARMFANELSILTSQKSLHYLTLLPFGEAISCYGLTPNNTKYWCPICLKSEHITSDHLIWQIKGVSVCPDHNVKLRNTCSNCGSEQPIINRKEVTPGYCWDCKFPLYIGANSNDLIDENEIHKSQVIASLLQSSQQSVGFEEKM